MITLLGICTMRYLATVEEAVAYSVHGAAKCIGMTVKNVSF